MQLITFSCINVETIGKYKNVIYFSSLKKFHTQIMSFYHINIETIGKLIFFFFSKQEKFTSPANEFLLHKCRNKNRKRNYFSKLKKFLQVQLMNFYYILETIGKWKNDFFFQIWKNIQVQLMSFHYINAETKIIFFFRSEKMYKSS